ncbi:MAG: hypothetical protein ACLSB9_28005 [Hydrogeniiclostridium mannosilyticum]
MKCGHCNHRCPFHVDQVSEWRRCLTFDNSKETL